MSKQNYLNTAIGFASRYSFIAGSTTQLSKDFSKMPWIDFKKKYKIKQSESNFSASYRRAVNQLKNSNNPLYQQRAKEMESGYKQRISNRQLKRKIKKKQPKQQQQQKQPQHKKYPHRFKQSYGQNTAHCVIQKQSQSVGSLFTDIIEFDCSYDKPDDGMLALISTSYFVNYSTPDKTRYIYQIKGLGSRFTILLQTTMFTRAFSTKYKQYFHETALNNEIYNQLKAMITTTASVDILGVEISVEVFY